MIFDKKNLLAQNLSTTLLSLENFEINNKFRVMQGTSKISLRDIHMEGKVGAYKLEEPTHLMVKDWPLVTLTWLGPVYDFLECKK